MVFKKALYNANLFIADNSKPTHRDSRTNSSDIIDYIISSPAIFNKIQNLTLNNDLTSDHTAILFDFLTNFNKYILSPIKVKLYHKAEWDSINSSHSNQLTFYRIRSSILYLPKTLILSTLSTMQPLFLLTLF